MIVMIIVGEKLESALGKGGWGVIGYLAAMSAAWALGTAWSHWGHPVLQRKLGSP